MILRINWKELEENCREHPDYFVITCQALQTIAEQVLPCI
jgi:hypothetical protein